MKQTSEPAVITGLHELLKWHMRTTVRFRKSHRVALVERIDNHLYPPGTVVYVPSVWARDANDVRIIFP